MRKYHPLKELWLARLRQFAREPAAVFWVYGFPLLLALGLGAAFRNRPVDQVFVDVEASPGAGEVADALARWPEFVVGTHSAELCRERLRLGKSSITVIPGNSYTFLFDPTRPESALARARVDDALQRAAGRRDPVQTSERLVTEPGGRYIDFLVPGLLGMNLMGGGLWGVGFVIVDMRIRKLLKRLIATPMRRRDFLLGLAVSRLFFTTVEVLLLLLFGYFAFGVGVRGWVLDLVLLIVLGASAFAGLGLLVACRAKTTEAVSGLMNLVMLPMWLMTGVFFSSERFPDGMQPFIRALPLTALNDALRAVMLDGASLASQWREVAV